MNKPVNNSNRAPLVYDDCADRPEHELPRLVALRHLFGGLDPVSNEFSKFRDIHVEHHTIPVREYLDCLTALVERDLVDRSTSVLDLFEKPEDCEKLAQLMENYPCWVNVRHLHAFMVLTDCSEADCASYSCMAQSLRHAMKRSQKVTYNHSYTMIATNRRDAARAKILLSPWLKEGSWVTDKAETFVQVEFSFDRGHAPLPGKREVRFILNEIDDYDFMVSTLRYADEENEQPVDWHDGFTRTPSLDKIRLVKAAMDEADRTIPGLMSGLERLFAPTSPSSQANSHGKGWLGALSPDGARTAAQNQSKHAQLKR